MAGKGRGGSGGAAVLEAPPAEGAAHYVDTRNEAERAAAPVGVLTVSGDAPTVTPQQGAHSLEFAMLPLTSIAESPYNPRKHFDAKELAELTASVRIDGVWEPVLVRPHKSGDGVYELASGHRRFRAAKAAGLAEVPARILPLDDETFIKLLTIANLQREDVHPLEQADAFAVQMKEFGWKPDRIARECGRGETFVYDHLKFLTLIEPIRDLFFADRITTAHAVELTRLTPAQQKVAIDPEKGGLWTGELLSDQLSLEAEEAEQRKDPYYGRKVVTFRELKLWVQDHLRFDVKAADPVLFASVAAVEQAAASKLKIVAITWDDYPRDAVKRAPGEKLLTPTYWRRADGLDGSEPCEYSGKVLGVVESGPDQGAAYHVCMAREKCTLHWGDRIKARAKAAKASAPKKGGKATTRAEPKEQPWERQQRLRDAADAAFRPAFPAAREALVEAVLKAPFKAAGALERLVLLRESIDAEVVKRVPKLRTAEDLVRRIALSRVLRVSQHWAREEFPRLGKLLGVDVAKIAKAHAPVPAKAVVEESSATPKEKKAGIPQGKSTSKKKGKR